MFIFALLRRLFQWVLGAEWWDVYRWNLRCLHHSWGDNLLPYLTVRRFITARVQSYIQRSRHILQGAGWQPEWRLFCSVRGGQGVMHQHGHTKEREQVEECSQSNVLNKPKGRVSAETQREGVVSQCLKQGGLNQKEGRLNWASSLKRNYFECF